MPDFIPRQDARAAAWGANFAQQVQANYQTFGFSQGDAEQLLALQVQFSDAVRTANCASTRTGPAVVVKNQARKAFEKQARWMAGWIRVRSEFSQATKIGLGILIGPGRDARRRRIGRPSSAPRVRILDVEGSRVSIWLGNSDWPSKTGMVPDIGGAIVYAYVGEQHPARVGDWGVMRGTSTARMVIKLPPTHAPGAKVWIAAQWTNARQEAGPLSQPVFTYLGYATAAPGRKVA